MLATHRASSSKAKPRTSLDTTPRDSVSTDADEATPQTVLSSSTELFYFYGQSLQQCAKLSTTSCPGDQHSGLLSTTALEVSSPQLYETSIEHCPDVARGEHQREDPGQF
jgi:hypothetical protein